jgi:hypothetical protein
LIDDVLVNAPVSAKTTFDSSKTIIKNRRKLSTDIKITFLPFTKKIKLGHINTNNNSIKQVEIDIYNLITLKV